MAKSGPHYFFKVFFPDQSSNQLRIPPAFRQHIEAETSNRVSLKGRSGSIWHVHLVKDSSEFFFEDGWKEFVADQSLVMGDFLVFRYNGDSRFNVLVFDSTACEKEKAFLARPSGEEEIDVSEGREEVEEEESMGEDDEKKPLIFFKKGIVEGNLKRERGGDAIFPMGAASTKKTKRSQTVTVWTNTRTKLSHRKEHLSPNSGALITPKLEGKSYLPYSSSQSSRGTLMQKSGKTMNRNSVSSVRYTGMNKEAKPKYQSGQVSRSSPHSKKMCTSKKSTKALESVKFCKIACPREVSRVRVASLISQRRPITAEEVESAHERAMSFKSDNPFAIVVMRESYVYTSFFMSIPALFAREHLPKENTVMTVWDPTDKPWKITYISYTYTGAFSGGWGKFSYANNLEKYDACVFELIEKTHLRVHIYRVVEKITPLLRRGQPRRTIV